MEKMDKMKSMWRPFPFVHGDPPSDIYKILNDEQVAQIVKLEVEYELAVAEAKAKFYKQLAAQMADMKM